MKLEPMVDYVLQQNKILDKEMKLSEFHSNLADSFDKIVMRANFLKQPPMLGMFVPVDEEGNVLEKPKNYDIAEPIIKNHLNHKAGKKKENEYKFHAYQKAKEKVMFEGFEFPDDECENTGLHILRKGQKKIWNWVLDNAELYEDPILNVKGKLSLWDFEK